MIDDNAYYVSHKAQCPFYQREKLRMIFCEGICDNCESVQKFKDPPDKSAHVHTYCYDSKKFRKCLVYKMLFEKYKGDPG